MKVAQDSGFLPTVSHCSIIPAAAQCVASAYADVIAAGITKTASPTTNITAVATENVVKAVLLTLSLVFTTKLAYMVWIYPFSEKMYREIIRKRRKEEIDLLFEIFVILSKITI